VKRCKLAPRQLTEFFKTKRKIGGTLMPLARYSGSLAYRFVPARRIEKAVQSGHAD
jgi:hypothetical protein